MRTCRDFYDASYLDQPCGNIADICRWEVFGSFAEQTKYASAPQSAKRPGPGRRKLTTARVVIVEVSRGRCPFILHAEICSLWPAGNTRHSHRGSFDSRLIPLCCNSAVGSVLLGLFQGGIRAYPLRRGTAAKQGGQPDESDSFHGRVGLSLLTGERKF